MTAPPLFHLRAGSQKLVVSIPHAGTWLPPDIAAQLTPLGRTVPDTDWHVDRLYGFLEALDVTVIAATHSRYVVDLNRAPGGGALYPGQAETGICPTETFAGEPIYAGPPPDAAERARRVALYWQPYHDALAASLARLKAVHGEVRLLDAHSILGAVPRLFEGQLPDLNFGTNDGAACNEVLARRVAQAAEGAGFSQVLNGRFKGGYITRHYGNPAMGLNVMQLELAQRVYMLENDPADFQPARATALVVVLRRIVTELLGPGGIL
jgi:N-formylglutamate deformylase